MTGFEYQRETVAKGSVLRRILLFGSVGVLTCGGLWLLAPSGEEKKPVETPAEKAPADTPAGASGESATEILPPEQNAGTAPSGESGTVAGTGESAAGEGTGTEAPSETAPDPAEKAGAETAPGATAVPEKDRPWVGDVPAAEDAPLVPPGPGGESVAGAGDATGAMVPYSAVWRKQAKTLTEENWALLSGKGPAGQGTVSHKVVSGDSLSRLAVKYHCTVEAIRRRNGLKTDRIRVGMRLVLVPGPWRVEVSKSARMLTVFRKQGGREDLFFAADVGIGRLGKTPTADFTICARLRHPAWYAPDGAVYPYGDSGNPLGEYFLKLAVAGRDGRPLRGFGIHGTRDEAEVTRSRSNGCIRMRNRDVERLYLLLPVGTPVRIAD